MAKKKQAETNGLRTYVHVRDEAGEPHVFGPEDDLPGWAKDAITNPKAWDDYDPSVDDDYSVRATSYPAADPSQVAGFGGDITEGAPAQLKAGKSARASKSDEE